MKKRDYLLLSVLAVFTLLIIYALYTIKSEGTKCMANPYTYSALQLELANKAPVLCQCNIAKGQGGILYFTKDNDSLVSNEVEMPYVPPNFNFTLD